MGLIEKVVTLSLSACWQISACFVGLYLDSLYNLCADVFLYHFKYSIALDLLLNVNPCFTILLCSLVSIILHFIFWVLLVV